MLLPHIHREGSTLAPAGHSGEAGEQTSHPPSAAASPTGAALWGKTEGQVKALMGERPTLWPGSAGESSSQRSLRGVLEVLKLAWKLHLKAKVIPVAAAARQQSHIPLFLQPFTPHSPPEPCRA